MPLTNANNGRHKDSSQDKLTLHNQKATHQSDEELERLLENGVSLSQETVLPRSQPYKLKLRTRTTKFQQRVISREH